MKFFKSILILIAFATSTFAQKAEIEQLMQSARKGEQYKGSTKAIYNIKNERKVSNLLYAYYTDTLPQVRSSAFGIVVSIGKKSENKEIRVEAINILAQACLYKDNLSVSKAVKSLKYFNKDEFSDDAKKAILKAVLSEPPYLKDFVMLAGFLQLNKSAQYLKNQIREGKINKTNKWKTYVALARMGDQEAIDYITARLKNMPKVNDDIVYELIPDLIFTRSHEVYEFITKILYDDKKNCHPANPEKTNKILCGYRVMEFLAPVVIGFPYKQTTSGDLDTKNYDKALQDVRKWFLENQDFQLVMDVY